MSNRTLPKINGKLTRENVTALVERFGKDKVAKAFGYATTAFITQIVEGKRKPTQSKIDAARRMVRGETKRRTLAREGRLVLEPGVKYWLPDDEDTYVIVLTPEMADRVRTCHYYEVDGFQRDLSEAKVEGVHFSLNFYDWYTAPPILLAQVGEFLYDVDGQHRREGHIRAKRSSVALVKVQSVQEARKNFIHVNRTASALPPKPTLLGSRGKDLEANTILSVMDCFGLTDSQARLLFEGLLVRHGDSKNSGWMSFITNAKYPKLVVKQAMTVARVWTSTPGWRARLLKGGKRTSVRIDRETRYGTFSCSGMFRLLGSFARDYYDLKKLEKALLMLAASKNWGKDAPLVARYSGGKDQHKYLVTVAQAIVGEEFQASQVVDVYDAPAVLNRQKLRDETKDDPYIQERRKITAAKRKKAKLRRAAQGF